MAQYGFGVGTMYATRTDTSGNTPIQFGELQDGSVDISFDLKELYGQKQFPVDIARGKGKITGKAKYARIRGLIFNSIFCGIASASGDSLIVEGEEHTIPGATPWTVTVTNATDYTEDMGVEYADTGISFVKVAATPTVGQYAVNESTGVYTFAEADEDLDVLISYSYEPATPVGTKTVLTNQTLGTTPTFKLQWKQTYKSNIYYVTLHNCISNKFNLAMKLDDHVIHDFDFHAGANSSNQVLTIQSTE